MDLGSLTSKKIAGIPALYLILVVAAAGLYGAFKLKPSTATADATATDSVDIAGDSAGDTSQPVFQATPVITQVSGTVSSVASVTGPDTDDLWKRRAVEYLVSPSGGYSLDVASSAITKYLAGEPLSTVEAGARDKAVQQYGIPPESVPVSTVETPTTPVYSGPASKQGSPPTRHTVKGTSDDTLTELCNLYYGAAAASMLTLVKANNPGLPTGRIPVGRVVIIPKLIQPVYYKATSATRDVYAIARKNGTTAGLVVGLNPGMHFPVSIGTRVRVH